MAQRDISYGELVALEVEFNKQVQEQGVTFHDDEYHQEALNDFIQQYQDGNDNPQLVLNYPNRHTIKK